MQVKPRRRWHVFAWKAPLHLLVLLISASLELATAITWYAYLAADGGRDRFRAWWRAFRCELPSWWER